MFKFAGLLLLLGLAVGLWLGFNPQAHREALQSWDGAKAVSVNIQTQVSAKLHEWTGQSGSQEQSAPNSAPRPTETAWGQLTSILHTLWSSIQRFWLSISAKLHLHKG